MELSIQGRERWVIGWYGLLCLVMLLRWRLLQRFLSLPNKSYFPYQHWHKLFFIGVVATGLMLGFGAALLMPYITANVQIILHAMLLTMCAGAIVLSRVERLVYGAGDPKAGACGSLMNVPHDERLNHLVKIDSGFMEEECSFLLRSFFEELRKKKEAGAG